MAEILLYVAYSENGYVFIIKDHDDDDGGEDKRANERGRRVF